MPKLEKQSYIAQSLKTTEDKRTEGLRDPDLQPGKRKKDLVIMDFHGTMTENQARVVRSVHHAAHEAFSEHVGKEFYQALLSRPSRTSRDATSSVDYLKAQFKEKGYTPEQIEWYIQRYKGYMDSVYIPIAGIPQTMRALSANGVDIALLTNGSNRTVIEESLKRWRLPELAQNLHSSHTTGYRKPDVRTVKHILRDYETQGKKFVPEQVLMVGDYIDDTKTASGMGIDFALIIRGNGWESFKLRDPKPTYAITDPRDLIDIVKGKLPPETRAQIDIPPVFWTKECWGRQIETHEKQK